jgi:hypothetical protein
LHLTSTGKLFLAADDAPRSAYATRTPASPAMPGKHHTGAILERELARRQYESRQRGAELGALHGRRHYDDQNRLSRA